MLRSHAKIPGNIYIYIPWSHTWDTLQTSQIDHVNCQLDTLLLQISKLIYYSKASHDVINAVYVIHFNPLLFRLMLCIFYINVSQRLHLEPTVYNYFSCGWGLLLRSWKGSFRCIDPYIVSRGPFYKRFMGSWFKFRQNPSCFLLEIENKNMCAKLQADCIFFNIRANRFISVHEHTWLCKQATPIVHVWRVCYSRELVKSPLQRVGL